VIGTDGLFLSRSEHLCSASRLLLVVGSLARRLCGFGQSVLELRFLARMADLENSSYLSGTTKLPANNSASFPFRFLAEACPRFAPRDNFSRCPECNRVLFLVKLKLALPILMRDRCSHETYTNKAFTQDELRERYQSRRDAEEQSAAHQVDSPAP
jgi:hypothetical protein